MLDELLDIILIQKQMSHFNAKMLTKTFYNYSNNIFCKKGVYD